MELGFVKNLETYGVCVREIGMEILKYLDFCGYLWEVVGFMGWGWMGVGNKVGKNTLEFDCGYRNVMM